MRSISLRLPVAAVALTAALALPVSATGQVDAADGDELLRIEADVSIAADPGAVWAALTTPSGLAGWIAPESRVELEPGRLKAFVETGVPSRGR